MERDKLQEQIVYFPKRERFKFELEASPSTDLISSLRDQPSSKSRKLEEHSVQASPAVASSRSVILKNHIQLVNDSIESRQFIKALQLINALQSEFPPSPLVLALKALVYEKIASKVEVLFSQTPRTTWSLIYRVFQMCWQH
ncbi:hypothetical protein MKX03_033731 [Papaver bracteatum]|nr:hypothetical protein MKX03_033731 [Papaver bracteatum]